MFTPKKIALSLAVLIVALVLVHYYTQSDKLDYKAQAKAVINEVTHKPTKLERTQALIDQLQLEREQDPTFIKATEEERQLLDKEIARLEREFKARRKEQSRLDALFVLQTQMDVELSNIEI